MDEIGVRSGLSRVLGYFEIRGISKG